MKQPSKRGSDRRPAFSIVSIARNEATRLPRLLDSLEAFRSRGGEVLVLDTGSTDDTVRVAQQAGCRVFVEPERFGGRLTAAQARRIHKTFSRGGEPPFLNSGQRLFNVAGARAHAAELARHPFQIALDGSDVVEAMDLDFLDAAARSREFPTACFESRDWSPTGWILGSREFIYDRRRVTWQGRSHSFLVSRSSQAAPKPALLKRDRLLVSHHTDLEKSRARQLAGLALDAVADPASDRWAYYLGRALAGGGFPHSALPLLLRLDRPEAAPALRSAGLSLAAHCLAVSNGPGEEIDALLFRAFKRDPHRREPLLKLASRCLTGGDMQGAASFATAALAIPRRAGVMEPEANYSERPHEILYWALLWLGRREEAKSHFDICREMDPSNAAYLAHARFFADPGTEARARARRARRS